MATHHDTNFFADLIDEVDHVRSGGGSSTEYQELGPATAMQKVHDIDSIMDVNIMCIYYENTVLIYGL